MFDRSKTIVFILTFLIAALLLSGGVLQAQPPPGRGGPVPEPGATRTYPLAISGTVTEEGGGIEGASVDIYDEDFNWINSGSTQADGQYSVSVPAGTYYVDVGLEGYRWEIYNNKPYLVWPPEEADPVTVSDSDVSGIDFSLIKLLSGLTLSETAISPSPADGVKDSTAIGYTLLQPGNVTVAIWWEDEAGYWESIRTLLSNEPQAAGSYSVVWDGRTDLGKIRSAEYWYNISVNDGSGWAWGWGSTILVDTKRPDVSSVKARPDTFRPSAGQSATLSYKLKDNLADWGLEVTILIYDARRSLVRTLGPEYQGAGENSMVWDGTDDDGNIVAKGNYTFTVRATDVAGNSSSKKAKVKVR